eukprot:CAMPEP_0117686858 /NCGR_PEP_ID=MMETSP0804-20121206/22746_1 /TAXON_ID=1074897 /ORGANISM="Tetraselmis astigmatica, Strain CCMP880" /LENGTH=499 /DNA_ID=CAMNT_0005498723 /DNA_START=71 /DNA_END=1570 /DNA_ORIENTATION=+
MSYLACSSACLRVEAGRTSLPLKKPAHRAAALRPARASSVEVTNNAGEARAWIEAWRAKQTPSRGSEQAFRAGISLQLQKSAADKLEAQAEKGPAGSRTAQQHAGDMATAQEQTLKTIQEESIATQRRLREQTAAIAAQALQGAIQLQLNRSSMGGGSADAPRPSYIRKRSSRAKAAEVPEEALKAAAQGSSADIQRRLREEAEVMPDDLMKAAISRQLKLSASDNLPLKPATDEAYLTASIETQNQLRADASAMSDSVMKDAIARQLKRSSQADTFILTGPDQEGTLSSVEAQRRLQEKASSLANDVMEIALRRQLERSASQDFPPPKSVDDGLPEPEAADSAAIQKRLRESAALLAEDVVNAAIARQLQNSASKPTRRKSRKQQRKSSVETQARLRAGAAAASEAAVKEAIARQLERSTAKSPSIVSTPSAQPVPEAAATAGAATAPDQASASGSSSSGGSGSSSIAPTSKDEGIITYTAAQLDAFSLEDALKKLST